MMLLMAFAYVVGPWLLTATTLYALLVALRKWPVAPPTPRALRTTALILMALAVGTALAWRFGIDQQSMVVRPLRWEVLDSMRNGEPEIKFTHPDYPGYFEVIASRELAEWLAQQGTPILPGTFQVTRDFGRVRGYLLMRVGERTVWTLDGSGGREGVGEPGPSPFD